MNKKNLTENNFEPGVSGNTGAMNYATGYGTPSYAQQDPDHFQSSKSNHNSNTSKDNPKSKEDTDQQMNAIWSKKNTPTPDEIVAGIKYELGQQNKKDKRKAKEAVLDNLRKDPKFYTGLKMLNIDDESMVNNMTENKHPNDAPARAKVTPNIAETKKIFAEMAKGRDQKYVVNSQICDVMKEMWEAKKKRSNWGG